VLSLFQQAGWQVTALTLTPASACEIESAFRCRAVSCDITQRGELEAMTFPGFDAVVDCVSAGGAIRGIPRIYFEGANNLIEVLNRNGYYSPAAVLFTDRTTARG